MVIYSSYCTGMVEGGARRAARGEEDLFSLGLEFGASNMVFSNGNYTIYIDVYVYNIAFP